MKNFFTFSAICRKQFFIFLVTLSLCLSANLVYPQLKIVSSGNVGIDTSNPLSRFSIGDAGIEDLVGIRTTSGACDLVPEDADGKPSIDYPGLPPVLAETAREQQAGIETLKMQVNQ
ncbi:MAG: hypothetical protein AB2L24_27710 [Mangrovibacterium sp.]